MIETPDTGNGVAMPEIVRMPTPDQFRGYITPEQLKQFKSPELQLVLVEMSKVHEALQFFGEVVIDLNNIHVRGLIERENRRNRTRKLVLIWILATLATATVAAAARALIG